ncbi:MAG: DUF2877 domain-containing protein [Synergistetes bacterium]|nr:DUF2877 domain-containing protein [Synergistota bacterium]
MILIHSSDEINLDKVKGFGENLYEGLLKISPELMSNLKLYAVSRVLLRFSGRGYVIGNFKRGILLKLGSAFVSILFVPELSHPLSVVAKRGGLAFPVFLGMRARLENRILYLGDNLIPLDSGFIWNPRVPFLSKTHLLQVRDVLSDLPPLHESLEIWCRACEESLRKGREISFVEEAISMLGFGEGSTPLADDIIGGMALGLLLTRESNTLSFLRREMLRFRDKTAEYSFKMILLLSTGLVPWSLRTFLIAPCERKLRKVLSLGSSSGLGMLRGIKTILYAIE